ncbi:MAG: hypothetical protein OSA99_06030 [Acidimicrobiales bacterium]|nr:hypothetical protein [Acidimicrobiales bacterium]
MTTTRTRPLRAEGEDLDEHPLASSAPGEHTEPSERSRRLPERTTVGSLNALDWRQAVGGAMIGLGMLGILVAWFGVSGTLDPGKQMPYISSGGFGGSALIAVGVTLLVSFEHIRDREALQSVLDELDDVRHRLDALHGGAVTASENGS